MTADFRVDSIYTDEELGEVFAKCYDNVYGESFEKYLGEANSYEGKRNAEMLLQDSSFQISDDMKNEIKELFNLDSFSIEDDSEVSSEDEVKFEEPTFADRDEMEESFEKGSNVSIVESLNRLDRCTDNKYDLRNLYESVMLNDNEKKDLATLICENKGAEVIYSVLNEKFIYGEWNCEKLQESFDDDDCIRLTGYQIYELKDFAADALSKEILNGQFSVADIICDGDKCTVIGDLQDDDTFESYRVKFDVTRKLNDTEDLSECTDLEEDYDVVKMNDKYFPKVDIEDTDRYEYVQYKDKDFAYDKKDNVLHYLFKDEEEVDIFGSLDKTPFRSLDAAGFSADSWADKDVRDEYLDSYASDLDDEASYMIQDFIQNELPMYKEKGLNEAWEKGEPVTLWWKDPSWDKHAPCYASCEYVGKTRDGKHKFVSETYGWTYLLDVENKKVITPQGKEFDVFNESGWLNNHMNESKSINEDKYSRDLAKRLKSLTNGDEGKKSSNKNKGKKIATWKVVQTSGARLTVADDFLSEYEAAKYVEEHGGTGKLKVVKNDSANESINEDVDVKEIYSFDEDTTMTLVKDDIIDFPGTYAFTATFDEGELQGKTFSFVGGENAENFLKSVGRSPLEEPTWFLKVDGKEGIFFCDANEWKDTNLLGEGASLTNSPLSLAGPIPYAVRLLFEMDQFVMDVYDNDYWLMYGVPDGEFEETTSDEAEQNFTDHEWLITNSEDGSFSKHDFEAFLDTFKDCTRSNRDYDKDERQRIIKAAESLLDNE